MHSKVRRDTLLLRAAIAVSIGTVLSIVPSARGQAGQPAGKAPQQAAVSNTDDSQTPTANPARPTITNPARIPPVGYLQFEQGFVQANESPQLARQFSINQTTKLALTSRLMAQFFSQPFAQTTVPGGGTRDTGDLLAGPQVILFNGTQKLAPTVALGYIGRVRSGTAPDLDIGSFSQSALILISGDVGKFHYDSNFVVSEQKSSPVRRAQYGQTISVTRPIFNPNLSLTGELWHFTQPFVAPSAHASAGLGSNAVGTLWALGYSLRPNLVFDAGLDHGLTATSTQWEGVAGFTYLLPKRLWKKR